MERTIGFNREPVLDHSAYDEYRGQYVTITPMAGGSVSGKVCDIRDGHIILNPHQGQDWDPKEGVIKKVVDRDSRVDCSKINAIESTTEENLVNYCEYYNSLESNNVRKKDSKKPDSSDQ